MTQINRRTFFLLSLIPVLNHASPVSLRLNIGLTDMSNDTTATIVQKFDNIKAYQLITGFGTSTYAAMTNNGAPFRLGQIFIKDADGTYQNSEEFNTDNAVVYLAEYELPPGDDWSISFANTIVGDAANSNPFSTTNDDSNEESFGDYTTVKVSHATQFSTLDAKQSANRYVSAPWSATNNSVIDEFGYLVTPSQFDKMKELRNDLVDVTAEDGVSLGFVGTSHYNTIDAGINVSYDFGSLIMHGEIQGHYPLHLDARSTNDFIRFEPSGTLDVTLSATVDYQRGQIGAGVGIAQEKGDIILIPYKALDTDNTPVANLEVPGLDITGSYYEASTFAEQTDYNGPDSTNGPGDCTVCNQGTPLSPAKMLNVNELLYFVEIKAESLPVNDRGLSIYGRYRIGVSSGQNNDLRGITQAQNNLTIGALFQVM